ncbi:MAG: HAD family hydrolase [Polyangiaceae bacterium]|jgi:HAD superfamily hydrolase (TIGR01490 family)|nr:HAD family hydrolase [Polyangiaceae bacterium]MBK8937392.1 HAD family hydrolase [Polyangiaceae bacterium]
MTRLALFDMDRTLLEVETASLYVRYQRQIGEATLVDLLRTLGWVAQYTFGTLDMAKVAQKALRSLAGVPEIVVAARCDDWFRRVVERHLTDGGRLAVRAHQERGHTCAIVTGASAYASRPLARLLGVPHVVSTVFEVDADHRFTGRAVMPLCLGEGKLARAERLAEELSLSLDDAVFYTDSISDLPLLERVAEPVAVNPDPRLGRLARARGWRVETWRARP